MFNFKYRNMKSVELEKQLLCTTFSSNSFSLANRNKRKNSKHSRKESVQGIY